MSSTPVTIGETVEKMTEAIIAWSELRLVNVRKSNASFRRAHELSMVLKRTLEGRAALQGLVAHPDMQVRTTAASECLSWGSAEAVAVLEEVEAADIGPSLSAHYVLLEYRSGTLDMDW